MPIEKPDSEHGDYIASIRLPKTLMGGTSAMQTAGEEYLPREPKESAEAWKIRLNRTVLFNGFRRTVDKLAGDVFSKKVVSSEDMPDRIKQIMDDIDLTGKSVTRFSVDLFKSAVSEGVTHILVDFPVAKNGETATVESESKSGFRPYWVHITGENLIGGRVSRGPDGNYIVSEIRYKWVSKEPTGDFDNILVERIKVIRLDSFATYRKEKLAGKAKEAWILEDEGVNTLGAVPLVSIMFGDPISPFYAKCPLEDLAYLNLEHWQSKSDQRNILHRARVPLLFGKMLDTQRGTDGTSTGKVVIGANRMITTNQPEGDLKYVEISNSGAIESGRQDLQDIKSEMALFGLSLLMPRTGSIMATEKAIDSADTDSTLRSWAMIFEAALNQAVKYTGLWMGLKPNECGTVSVNNDFRAFIQDTEPAVLLQAYGQGLLPRQVVFDEYKRRGILRDDLDFVEVSAMIDSDQRSNPRLAGLAGTLLTPTTFQKG